MANDAFTNWFCDKLLNHVFRTTSYAQPGLLYVGLFTAAPTDAYTSGAPTGTECSGNGYARKSIDSIDAEWTLEAGAAGRRVKNTNQITFAQASGSWGTGNITHWGVFDGAGPAPTGELLLWGALTTPHAQPANGDIPFIAAGVLMIQLD